MSNITAQVESIAQGGMGVLRHQGRVIFIPEVIPGEVVEALVVQEKKNFAIARLLKLNFKSPQRLEPKCKHFSVCGGCNFQHMDYGLQVSAKKQLVIDALKRIGGLEVPVSIENAQKTWGYRRHIRLKLWPNSSSFVIGFMGKEKAFTPIEKCHIFDEDEKILAALTDLVAKFSKDFIKEARVTILKDGVKAVLFFEFEPLIPKNALLALKNLDPIFKGVILADSSGQKSIGEVDVEIQTAGLTFFCRPDAFVQNNPELSEKIYLDLISKIETLPKEPILDLYSGIGITSILLAKKGFKVLGVEISPKAVSLAKKNAQKNQVQVDFMALSAEETIERVLDAKSPQVVILNPPRVGAKPEVLLAILKKKPESIFYISCMPSTLARDLKILSKEYKVISCKAYDMFPHTTHVETLVHLAKA